MDIVIGLVGWVLVIWAVVALCTRGRKARPAARPTPLPAARPAALPTARPAALPAAQPLRTPPDPLGAGDTIGGWLLGHEIAHGHDGFPGDPLPNGHLGSPSNLAFWGGVFDDDPDDPDDAW